VSRADRARQLAVEVRRLSALCGDLIGQATLDDLPVPDAAVAVAAALAGWAWELEQLAGPVEGGQP
jgi:hypothetical protein